MLVRLVGQYGVYIVFLCECVKVNFHLSLDIADILLLMSSNFSFIKRFVKKQMSQAHYIDVISIAL